MNPNLIVNMFLQNNPTMRNNPIIQNAISMAQNGRTEELKALTENVAKEKGVDLNNLMQNLNLNLTNMRN